jgi:hypothetical protein
MIETIFNLGELFGLLVAAGFAGTLVARRKTQKIETRLSPPWSAYDRAGVVENIGFMSGAAGGGLVLFLVVLGWWLGWVHIVLPS